MSTALESRFPFCGLVLQNLQSRRMLLAFPHLSVFLSTIICSLAPCPGCHGVLAVIQTLTDFPGCSLLLFSLFDCFLGSLDCSNKVLATLVKIRRERRIPSFWRLVVQADDWLQLLRALVHSAERSVLALRHSKTCGAFRGLLPFRVSQSHLPQSHLNIPPSVRTVVRLHFILTGPG